MPNQVITDRLLDLLQAEEVDTLFGIPDPSFFALFLEAERRGMRIVSPHHEQAAALTAPLDVAGHPSEINAADTVSFRNPEPSP